MDQENSQSLSLTSISMMKIVRLKKLREETIIKIKKKKECIKILMKSLMSFTQLLSLHLQISKLNHIWVEVETFLSK